MIPTRSETSDNIWYRFHLRATDSAGLASEVARDVLPLKARFTLATLPTGLQLTGKLFGEPELLLLAHAFQSRTDHHLKHPVL